ncbi:MAG: hypothetical protein R2731_00150 [Nocardioides sp.]
MSRPTLRRVAVMAAAILLSLGVAAAPADAKGKDTGWGTGSIGGTG